MCFYIEDVTACFQEDIVPFIQTTSHAHLKGPVLDLVAFFFNIQTQSLISVHINISLSISIRISSSESSSSSNSIRKSIIICMNISTNISISSSISSYISGININRSITISIIRSNSSSIRSSKGIIRIGIIITKISD